MSVSLLIENGSIKLEDLENMASQELAELKPVNPIVKAAPPDDEFLRVAAVNPLSLIDQGANLFQPIGIGKPLGIRIHTMYSGKFSRRGRSKDILVVSGLKSEQTFGKSSRMINLLSSNVSNHEYMQFSAFEDGSPIVSYTPALTSTGLSCSFEVTANNFDDSLVESLGGLFGMAGKLPVFAPASTYLLAGSFLAKTISGLGNAFKKNNPVLVETLTLSFGTGGRTNFREGLYLVSRDSDSNARVFDDFSIQITGSGELVLKNSAGETYLGDAPYLVIGIDGKAEESLENFGQQAASAALLKEFYPSEGSSDVLIGELTNALGLYNDLKFRKKAQGLQAQIDGLPLGDTEIVKLQNLLDAYKKNIVSEELKLA